MTIDVGLVNYKTKQLTKICLEHLEKNVVPYVDNIWIVDNNSNDESLELLKKNKFINLLERKDKDFSGNVAHGKALDLIKSKSNADYLLIIHTDTFIFDGALIDQLLTEFKKNNKLFVVGCLHQINRGFLRFKYRFLSRFIKFLFRSIVFKFNKKTRRPASFNERWIKTFCACYDLNILKKYKLDFYSKNKVPSNLLQKKLLNLGYKRKIWTASKIFKYLDHVEEGTHAELGMNKNRIKRYSRFKSFTDKPNAT